MLDAHFVEQDMDKKLASPESRKRKACEGKAGKSQKKAPKASVLDEGKPASFGQPPVEASDTSLRAPGPQQICVADQNLEILPAECSLGIGLPTRQIKRETHTRSCRKLPASDKLVKERCIKQYLASIGVTWPVFQRQHYRRTGSNCSEVWMGEDGFVCTMCYVWNLSVRLNGAKSVSSCDAGGFVNLQRRFMQDDFDVSNFRCTICQSLLESHQFSEEKLKEALLDALKHSKVPELLPLQNAVDGETDEQPKPERAEPLLNTMSALIASYDGVFVQLEPGKHGKKFPVRCMVCKTHSFPDGKVIDMSSGKVSAAAHFLRQHCASAKHQRSMIAQEALEGEAHIAPEFVECEAYLLDGKGTGLLQKFITEMNLWATFVNLPEFAKHRYLKDKRD